MKKYVALMVLGFCSTAAFADIEVDITNTLQSGGLVLLLSTAAQRKSILVNDVAMTHITDTRKITPDIDPRNGRFSTIQTWGPVTVSGHLAGGPLASVLLTCTDPTPSPTKATKFAFYKSSDGKLNCGLVK